MQNACVTDAILILGYQLDEAGGLQDPLIRRIRLAKKLHDEYGMPIIASGWRPLKREDLGRYVEAWAVKNALWHWYALDEEVCIEEDSTSIPENLLFTRARFPNLVNLFVVTAFHAVERTEFLARMIYSGNASVQVIGCEDGASDPLREELMVGDVNCMFMSLHEDPEVEFRPGEWWKLMRLSGEDRLQSCWDELRMRHHGCEWHQNPHPASRLLG